MRYLLTFLTFFLVLCVAAFISIPLDLALNPWLRTVENLQWWNYATSNHGLTFMYLHFGSLSVIIAISVLAAIFAAVKRITQKP